MSIAGVGAYSNPNLSQMLSSLLSRLDTASASSTSSANDDQTSGSVTGSTSTTGTSIAMLNGPSRPSLSSMILGTLIGLQQQSGDASQDASSTSSSDPVQSLFSSMDSDGDGTVTQSELESYIEQQGGTQTEADNLYSMLDSSDGDGITESTLASDAPQGPPPGPPPGGMGGPPPGVAEDAGGSSDIGSQLLDALDTDGDGTVSQSEFESFVTSNGGTSTEADADFSALDSSGSGSLSATDFTDAMNNLQSKVNSGGYSPVLAFLDALSQGASQGTSVSLTA